VFLKEHVSAIKTGLKDLGREINSKFDKVDRKFERTDNKIDRLVYVFLGGLVLKGGFDFT